MEIWNQLRQQIKSIIYMNDEVDTLGAVEKIRSNIWFRGPNVWILAFSIVIASVGLNVNSTAVIIGAMLVSPLMGPIIGIGLALGTNDIPLLKNALKNLLVMVLISLVASCLYFLVSPLELVNPTELEARTRPTIYDVLIALFGGLAGILEISRKEKGTVLSGVAIATALMPPLCTAGYGLANGNWSFFSGASFLFLINCVFIIIATYVMVKYFHFPQAEFANDVIRKRTRTLISCIIIIVLVPSILSAISVVGDNNFERNVQQFINSSKFVGKAYIYDYKVSTKHGRKVDVYFAGSSLSEDEMKSVYDAAARYGIDQEQLVIQEHAMGGREEETDKLLQSIYERSDYELAQKNSRIRELEEELAALQQEKLPYAQIVREIRFNYPEVRDVFLGRGASVDDSLRVKECVTVVATSSKPIKDANLRKLEEWLRIRLNDSTAVVENVVVK